METAVVAGPSSLGIARELSSRIGASLVEPEVRRFPDGESFVRVPATLQGAHAVIVQNSYPNERFVDLLLLQDAVREAGAARITTAIPYLGYARQDRSFNAGEAVASRAAARAIATGTDAVLALDPHKQDVLRFFGKPAVVASAVPQLADRLRTLGADVILAPDAGARPRAQDAARRIGVRFDHLEKRRLSPTQVEMRAKDLDVSGARVAIVDDLIASGGTMVTAAAQLKLQGARSVVAACTHGMFNDNAVPRLLAGGIDRILATDSLPLPVGCEGLVDVVPCADALAEALAMTVA